MHFVVRNCSSWKLPLHICCRSLEGQDVLLSSVCVENCVYSMWLERESNECSHHWMQNCHFWNVIMKYTYSTSRHELCITISTLFHVHLQKIIRVTLQQGADEKYCALLLSTIVLTILQGKLDINGWIYIWEGKQNHAAACYIDPGLKHTCTNAATHVEWQILHVS